MLGSDEWIELEPGVWFLIQEDDGSGEGDQGDGGGDKPPGTASVTFTFKSYRKDAKTRINGFVARAYKWYVRQVRQQTDAARYLYTLEVGGASGGGDDDDEGGGGEDEDEDEDDDK